MAKDDWVAAAQANTEQLADAIKDLAHQLERHDYGKFWGDVKNVSKLFKELKPTVRLDRGGPVAIPVWRTMRPCQALGSKSRARPAAECVRSAAATGLIEDRKAYHQTRGAKSGSDLRVADDLLQQALGWMKDGFSGFGVGTQFFAMNDGKMTKEDHEVCWERWRGVKDSVRVRREEISSYNYGHFNSEACAARGLAQNYPKEAKDKVRSIQSEMKGRTMERWQFDEVRKILDDAYQQASAAQEQRHREWERKQQEWRSRLDVMPGRRSRG